VARNRVFAWILTIPAAAIIAGLLTYALKAAGVS
jgi:phosphate/sulfate permease